MGNKRNARKPSTRRRKRKADALLSTPSNSKKQSKDDSSVQDVTDQSPRDVTPSPPPNAKSATVHSKVHDEEEVVCLEVRNETKLPHMRCHCTVHMFVSQSDSNESYCENCWCFVCDVPSQECSNWSKHCHATNADAPSRRLRRIFQGKAAVFELCQENVLDNVLTSIIKMGLADVPMIWGLFETGVMLGKASGRFLNSGLSICMQFVFMPSMFQTYKSTEYSYVAETSSAQTLYTEVCDRRIQHTSGSSLVWSLGDNRLNLHDHPHNSTHLDAPRVDQSLLGRPPALPAAMISLHLSGELFRKAALGIQSSFMRDVSIVCAKSQDRIEVEFVALHAKSTSIVSHACFVGLPAGDFTWASPWKMDRLALLELASGPGRLAEHVVLNMGQSGLSLEFVFSREELRIYVDYRW